MKKITQSLAWATMLSLAVLLAGAPSAAYAATLTATETVASAPAGTDAQTNIAAASTTNVSQVKATRTLTVVSVPANAVTLTIGLCVVTFNTGATQDVNCSDNVAAINTTTDASTSTVGSRLRSLTGVSDTGHGALTVSGTSDPIFTTTGAETSATPITATLSSGAAITLTTVNTTGVIPVTQVSRVTPATVEVGDIFTAVINSASIAFTATVATVANVTAGLSAAINASAQASNVTATDQTTFISIASDASGTSFTLTAAGTNRPAVAQTVTFTPADIANADFNITINGTTYTTRASEGASAQEIVEVLSPLVDADAAVTCTEDDTKVTCAATVAGTSFTYSSDVTNVTVSSGGSSHSSGGGSRRSSSSNSSTASTNANLETQIAKLQAQIAALIAAKGGTSAPTVTGSFATDLTVGSTGADVMALQVYLNAKGFTVSATGPGSKGSETTMFGGATKAALAKFQASVGISPAAGYFGPKTRAYVVANP